MDVPIIEMNPFVSIFVFIAALAFSEFLLLSASNRRHTTQRRAARERLKRHATRIQRLDEREVESIFLEASSRGPILRFLTGLVPDRKPIDLWLYRAGLPMQLEGFLGITVLFSIIGYFAVNVVTGNPGLAISGAGAAILPFIFVQRKKNRRMMAFSQEFPEAIDLLCRSLRAGHPIQTGLRVVSEEVEEPVASELSQVVDEISMGLDARVALNNLGQRMNTQEMPFFVNALLIQRETGGDLPSVLASLAHTARERLQFQIKVDAIVSQTRLSANFLAMLPAAFMVLINFIAPTYLDPLFEPGAGETLLYVAIGLTVAGWLGCRALTAVKL
jgi:tight adherence protein B